MGADEHVTQYEYARNLIRAKARRLVGRYGFTQSDREDLEQDLTVFVLQQMRCFDPRRGGEEAFVDRLVNRKVVSIIRSRLAACRDYRRVSRSLDEPALRQQGQGDERGDALSEDADRRRTQKRGPSVVDLVIDMVGVLSKLDPDLKHVCEQLVSGKKKEAAAALGLSKSGMRTRSLTLREVFSAAGLRDYLDGE